MKHQRAAASPRTITGAATLLMLWDMLDRRERRLALAVCAMMIISALASAAMVVSVIPFLHVLADPAAIRTNETLAALFSLGSFSDAYEFTVALGAGTVAFIVVVNLVLFTSHYVLTRFALMRNYSLATRLLDSYLRQPYEFFLNRHSGDISKGVLSEVDQIVSKYMLSVGNLLAAVMTVAAIVLALIWVSPGIALGGLAIIGGSYAIIYGSVRMYLSHIGAQRLKANGQRFRIAGEALAGIKEIKVAGHEQSYLKRFMKPARTYARTQARAKVIDESPRFLLQIVLFGGIVLLCLLMIDRTAFESGVALGGLVPVLGAFALGAQKLMPETQKIFSALTKMRMVAPTVANIHADMMRANRLPALPKDQPEALRMAETLTFQRVSYRYPGADIAGLQDISLEIRRGERIGIVGPTGAGKSTFAGLILGLLQPQAGVIEVDGVALSDASVRAWQAGIGYVPQEIFLADNSIAENIAFGLAHNEIDRDQVERSASMAKIDSFIRDELPQGYDTFVGERGIRLSGGQRQRIGIARALYRDAGLIVFDEATSALDNLTEQDVMAAIDALPGDKTVLMIAHRLSTVRRCDRILVLDGGTIAGFGNWDGLAQNCPAFQRLIDVSKAA